MTAREKIAQDAGENCGLTVTRYIALTKLIPPLLALVDEAKLSLSTAADFISVLTEQEQTILTSAMDKLGVIPSRGQLLQIKEQRKTGTLTVTGIESILSTERPAATQVVIKRARLRQYFPPSYTAKQMEEVIVSLLETPTSLKELPPMRFVKDFFIISPQNPYCSTLAFASAHCFSNS